MTPKERAAMQQALEALVVAEEFVDRHSEDWYISGQQDLKQIREAITTLREALAEPKKPEECENGCPPLQVCDYCQIAEQAEHEPVAIDWEPLQNFWRNNSIIDWGELESAVKCAVAAPVRIKDLTDDEILRAVGITDPQGCIKHSEFIGDARAVIAADREKNK